MAERKVFPFRALLDERKQMFCELYASMIVHREMSAYEDMLDSIGNPQELISGGKITLNTVNKCVEAIERNYSHKGIMFLIDSIIDSVVSSFREENFEFFSLSMPQYRELIAEHHFDRSAVQMVDALLRSRLEGFRQVCSDLDRIYQNIHETFCQIYFAPTNYKGVQNKSTCTVGPVVFSSCGSPMGDAMADTVVKRIKQEELINSCMQHVYDYLKRVEAFHRLIMQSFHGIYQAFAEVSDSFNALELDLYRDLCGLSSEADDVFSSYYNTEIKMMHETYTLNISEDDNITFKEMIDRVYQMVPLYNKINQAA